MASPAKVLITGADGFVGRALAAHLRALAHPIVSVARKPGMSDAIATGDLADYRQWPTLLEGVSVVVHLAARAHITHALVPDELAEFRRVNVNMTLRLAQAAASAGVQRFVFLSSIGVNGTHTTGAAFSERDVASPTEAYAISKWEAEQGLLEIGARSKMQITRVRPPLVLGPGVKGNLLRLLHLVDWGVPLPLGAIRNRRSFVTLDDLCELLSLCVTDDRAAGELFLAANAEEISTSALMRAMADGLGRKLLLIPVPLPVLRGAASIVGGGSQLMRLSSSLRVDASHARTRLGWKSRTNLRAAIESMAQTYNRQKGRRDAP
jgi:nucleoside-diphosphate-sugar epimerase